MISIKIKLVCRSADLHWEIGDNVEMQPANLMRSTSGLDKSKSQDLQTGARYSLRNLQRSPEATSLADVQRKLPDIVWECAACTLLNGPAQPNCEACGRSRPVDYRIPDGYELRPTEQQWLERDQEAEREVKRPLNEHRAILLRAADLHCHNDEMQPGNLLQPTSGLQNTKRKRSSEANSLAGVQPKLPDIGWECMACTLVNMPKQPGCEACGRSRPEDYRIPDGYELRPTKQQRLERDQEAEREVERLLNEHRAILLRAADLHCHNDEMQPTSGLQNTKRKRSSDANSLAGVQPKLPDIGWECMACTLVNMPKQPGCEACGRSRPEDYRIPDGYELRPTEPQRLERDQNAEREVEIPLNEAEEKERTENMQNYLHLMELEDRDLVTNEDEFECHVCYTVVDKEQGVMLRDCLHMFCRECLANLITYSDEATVKCPYRDYDYSCDSTLQEREVRALVPIEDFERHLQKGVNFAESQAQNSFHCKTADCKGWCYFDDDVNEFLCPVCRHTNCLTCQVVHEGQNCREYQDRLNALADGNEAAMKTKQSIEVMLKNGDAMHCPGCNIVIMKKSGCDWIPCTICKVEICWATKGPRWGPAGKGDNSGGCKCGVGGVRCHPNCKYCH